MTGTDLTSWQEVSLGDVVTLQRGFDLPQQKRIEGPFPVVSSAGITGSHAEFKVRPPGVVIGRYGSLGTVHWVEEPFWPLNTSLWVKDFKSNDPRFIAYLLQTLTFDGSAASAVPGVNRNHLHKLPVKCPPFAIQRGIATVLSLFDELIELNRQRINSLSGLARALYREWFQRFRFPGFENTDFVDSHSGRIPENWTVQSVAEVFRVLGGGTPSKKVDAYWDEGTIPWFTPSDLTRDCRRYVSDSKAFITSLGLEKSSAQLFPAGSVLMTSRATLGVLAIAARESACNQGFVVIPPIDGIPAVFIREWLDASSEELKTIATGATFKEITKGAFKRFRVVLPDRQTLRRFGEALRPSEQEILVREEQNQALAACRDLLLPRLVTGKLDISDLDLDSLPSVDEAV